LATATDQRRELEDRLVDLLDWVIGWRQFAGSKNIS
jgi:hypothetical protein